MSNTHERLAKMPPDRLLQTLETLPKRAAEQGNVDLLRRLLTDFDFIEAKVSHPDINLQELIEDYERAFEPKELILGEKAETLRLIQGALRLSAHVLDKDETQLAGQLLGRLMSFEVPEIRAMLEQAKQGKNAPWLCPLTPSLTLPGGALLRTLIGHTGEVNAVVVSPDGQQIVSGSDDFTLKVWDLQTGREVRTLIGHTDKVNAVVITPDGQQVVSGSDDFTLKVWDLPTGRELRTLICHMSWINTVVVTSDGQQVVSGSHDRTLKVWDLETGRELFNLKGHKDGVNTVAVTSDRQWAVSGSRDTTLKVWDLQAGRELLTLTSRINQVNAVAVTPDGRWIVSGSDDFTLKVWDLETNWEPQTLTGHTSGVTAMTVSLDGSRMISGSEDGTLKVWNMQMCTELFILQGHTNRVNTLALTPDGRWVISGANDSNSTLRLLTATKLSESQWKRVMHNNYSNLKVWDLETRRELFNLKGHMGGVSAITIIPNYHGHLLAVCASTRPTLRVWEPKTHRRWYTLRINTRRINAIATVMPTEQELNGQILTVIASADGTLRVWPLMTDQVFIMKGHTDQVSDVAVTADGRWAVSGSFDHTLKLWDLIGGTEKRTFTGHTKEINAVAVTANGRFAISASSDNTLKVWDLDSGEVIASFSGEDVLECCAVAPDGVTIVAGERSGRVHFLRLEGVS